VRGTGCLLLSEHGLIQQMPTLWNADTAVTLRMVVTSQGQVFLGEDETYRCMVKNQG